MARREAIECVEIHLAKKGGLMKIAEASELGKSCETCSSLEEGGHYCLLRSIFIQNADLHICDDWEREEES